MDRFKSLALPISILVWILATLHFIQYMQDEYSEFERLKSDTIINYATDAAVDEMVDYSKDLQLDYGEWEYLSCDPEIALDTFVDYYLDSMGMLNTEANRAWVTATYCKCFIVATYNGYYVGQPTVINDSGARDIVFSLKKPYMYKNGDSYYALNLTRQDARRLKDGVLTTVDRPAELSENDVRMIINSQISDTLTTVVGEQMGWHNTETLYLPANMSSISRTNPIDATTVLVYMSGMPAGFGRTVDSFAIGGTRIEHQRFVGCYIKDGVKMYQYVDKLNESYDLIETFESPLEAAKKGYEFDISLELN